MNQPNNIIFWNTHGVNNNNFKRNFKEHIRIHNPCMVALVMVKEFRFTDCWETPPLGRSGVMVLFCQSHVISVTRKYKTPQELHTTTMVYPEQSTWLFFSIYPSTFSSQRLNLWDNLNNKVNSYDESWFLAGVVIIWVGGPLILLTALLFGPALITVNLLT